MLKSAKDLKAPAHDARQMVYERINRLLPLGAPDSTGKTLCAYSFVYLASSDPEPSQPTWKQPSVPVSCTVVRRAALYTLPISQTNILLSALSWLCVGSTSPSSLPEVLVFGQNIPGRRSGGFGGVHNWCFAPLMISQIWINFFR